MLVHNLVIWDFCKFQNDHEKSGVFKNIFWILTPYKIYDLQIFFPIV